MSLASNIQNGFVRVATEFKSIRTLISGSGTGDLTGLATADKSSLVAAINEVRSSAGVTTLDGLSDVTLTTPAGGDILRHNGAGQFVNVVGSTYFQPRDTDLDAIAALTTTAYGRALLSLADQAALTGAIRVADSTAVGVVELATDAEALTGTDTTRAVTPANLASRLANFQPLDSDLTSIAALATTAYGRAFLTLADQAALMGLVPASTETVQGKVELATNAETITGTDNTRATHPAGVKATIDGRIINDATLAGNSTTNAPSQASVKAYADALIGANDAMVFKGVIDASTNPNYPAANRGDTYKISVAGKIGGAAGPNVEVGDVVIATTDGTAAGTHATVGANWTIVQANVDGAVTGPAASVSGNLASFSGTGGKVIADSGFSVDNDGALAANSATRVPTQAAVKAYAQPLDADLTALAALTSAADRLPYFSGAGAASLATFTAFARTLLDDVDATAARATLGLGTAATQASTAFQPADTDLTAIAALVSAADQAPYATGPGTWALHTLTPFARTLLDDADAATARGTLAVYSQTEVGDPNTDFVATFNTALA